MVKPSARTGATATSGGNAATPLNVTNLPLFGRCDGMPQPGNGQRKPIRGIANGTDGYDADGSPIGGDAPATQGQISDVLSILGRPLFASTTLRAFCPGLQTTKVPICSPPSRSLACPRLVKE